MASGEQHDRSIVYGAPIVGAIAYFQSKNMNMALIIAFSYLIGGLFLSPDLDLKSDAYYRWKFLKWIWIPYQKLIPHRGRFFRRNFLSHAPIVGTAIRLVYLGGIAYCVMAVTNTFDLGYWTKLFFKYREVIYFIWVGLDVSGWVHLGMDIAYSGMRSRFKFTR